MTEAGQFVLQFISGKYRGGEFPLDPAKEVIIGRSSELDMVLVEDMVSRKHARITFEGGDFYIQDLGSTNGTFVNGERVKKQIIKAGDRILVGTSILKLERSGAPVEDEASAAAIAKPPEAKADAKAEAKPEAKPDSKPAEKEKKGGSPPPPPANDELFNDDLQEFLEDSEAKPAKAESKPPAKPAAKAEAKPAAKPESKPEAKPEPKPEAKPKPPAPPPADDALFDDEGEDLLADDDEPAPPKPAGKKISEPERPATGPDEPARNATSKVERSGGTSMSGNISEIPLPDLLQLFSTSRKTGVLHIAGEQGEAAFYIRNGIVINAVIENSAEEDPKHRAYAIINWSEGSFEMRHPSSLPKFDNEMDTPTSQLLMDAMQFKDELGRYRDLIPDEKATIKLRIPLGTKLRDLKPDELDALELAINSSTVQMACKLADKPKPETYKLLAGLIQKRLIQLR